MRGPYQGIRNKMGRVLAKKVKQEDAQTGFQKQFFIGNVIIFLLHLALVAPLFDAPSPMQIMIAKTELNREKSDWYYDQAARYMGSKGEGNQGWINLLAAYDHDPTSEFVLSNLVQNYRASNFTYLALDELFFVLEEFPNHKGAHDLVHQIRTESPEEWTRYQQRVKVEVDPSAKQKLGNPRFTAPFVTNFVRYEILNQYPQYGQLNSDFYKATISVYEKVKADLLTQNPRKTDTDINHDFFKWQMNILRSTGDYYSGFTDLSLFRDLIETMREGAAQLLQANGMKRELAEQKVKHDIIFWASVHTEKSVHEPHMTEDSLIGGVYYVTVPPHSGSLGIFDPRQIMVQGHPSPPFHRTYTVEPKEGMLCLFPGWLVHTVYQSKHLNVAKDGYRVSISLNLKGEWQDTGKLGLDHVPLL